MVFFLISDILGLLNQLKIFWQLYQIELPRLSTGLRLLKLYSSSYIQCFWQGFTCWSSSQTYVLVKFQVRYVALFLLFSVMAALDVSGLHKNIQLLLEFFQGRFLVLHFSCYTLMTFLVMLSVVLLSMWMILLSTLNVIRHLICSNN